MEKDARLSPTADAAPPLLCTLTVERDCVRQTPGEGQVVGGRWRRDRNGTTLCTTRARGTCACTDCVSSMCCWHVLCCAVALRCASLIVVRAAQHVPPWSVSQGGYACGCAGYACVRGALSVCVCCARGVYMRVAVTRRRTADAALQP